MNEFEQAVMDMLRRRGNVLDINTDMDGQFVIYTGLAETQDGEIVEFDSNAPEGTYKVSA